MKNITLTEEELKELVSAIQGKSEFVLEMAKDDYIVNVSIKNELIVIIFIPKDNELVVFNIITKDGEMLFDEEVIFMVLEKDLIKAGIKNGEVISIDNIISK